MTYKDYSFLKNTYWCVPERSVIALGYDQTNVRVPKHVQVVWHITNVINNEYIVGKCYSHFNEYTVSNINAMINHDGVITMMFLDPTRKENIFSTGQLMNIKDIEPPFPYQDKYVKLGFDTVFQMQVNLPAILNGQVLPNTFLLHNAYMVQTSPDTLIWYNLPTTNNTVPEYISEAIKSIQ